MTNNGILHRTFGWLVPHRQSARSRTDRRLAPLQELEDRCLLSVTPVGAEYRVNTYTQGNQQTFPQTPHAVAMNPTNGNYVVVWSSQGQNGGGAWDVYFQRYNAAGVPQGAETLVDVPVAGVNQEYANVAMNSSGNFVVTWSSQFLGNWNVYARQFNANGVAVGLPILVDTPSSADQEYSTVAINDGGYFVVAWSDHSSGTWQIWAHAFNSGGTSLAFGAITNTTGDQMFPDVAVNDADNVVVTWSGHQAAHWNVYGELFTSFNQTVGTIFQVNTNMTDDQQYSSVAMDSSGNFTIAWSGHQTGQWNIYAQSYLASGAANGSNFQVNATTGQDQEYSSIALAGDGNPIITWSHDGGGINGWGVFAQQVTPTGALVGGEIHVNTYIVGDQIYPSIAGAANGTVAIVWTSQNQDGSGAGVYGQDFTTNAAAASVHVTGSDILVSEDNRVLLINASTGAVVADYPTGLVNGGATFGPDGSLYVADYYTNQIDHYSASGTLLPSFGAGELTAPQGLAFGPDGNLYVANANGAVDTFTPTGSFVGTFIAAGSGGLTNAKTIVWGPDGNAYVSSYFNSEVIRYNGTTGAFMNVFATGGGGFEGIAFGPDGNLYAASYGDNAVYQFDGTTGASLGTFASGPRLDNPYGLSFDAAGNLDVTNQTSGTIATFSGANGAFLGTLASGLTNPGYLTTGNSSVYGQPVTYTATVSAVAPATGTPTGAVTFLDGTTDLATVSLTGGMAVYTTTALAVGSHDITVEYSGDSSYTANSSTTLVQAITPATLTVTADNASKTYGQSLTFAGSEFTTSGLVNADTVSSVTLASAGATATATVSGSPYTITTAAAIGTGLSNYNIIYVNGALTVTPATLIITADNASKVYGQTLTLTGSEFTTSGLVNSDSVTSVALASAGSAATATVSGSPYAVTASAATGTGLGNYNLSYDDGALTVTPATLTVTANDATKVAGHANPAFTDALTGFVNGDTRAVVTGNASLSTTATTGSGAGSYPIMAGPGSLNAANYTFAFANGTLTISPANSGTPASPLSPPTSPTLPGSIVLMPGSLPSSSTVSGAAGVNAASLPNSAAASTSSHSALLLTATGSNSRGNEVALEASLATVPGVNSTTRTTLVFSAVPQVTWRDAQIVSVPEVTETPLEVLGARVSTVSASTPQARVAQADDGLDVLNDEGERVQWIEPALETTAVVGTGVIAAGGYVLLNSRIGLWLLGLVTSQPLWKQFDPLEVLYAWDERAGLMTEDQDDETLLSLVD